MVALGVQVNGHPHHEITHDEVPSSAGKVVLLLDVTFQIADKAMHDLTWMLPLMVT
jgi:hypothetical protein